MRALYRPISFGSVGGYSGGGGDKMHRPSTYNGNRFSRSPRRRSGDPGHTESQVRPQMGVVYRRKITFLCLFVLINCVSNRGPECVAEFPSLTGRRVEGRIFLGDAGAWLFHNNHNFIKSTFRLRSKRRRWRDGMGIWHKVRNGDSNLLRER